MTKSQSKQSRRQAAKRAAERRRLIVGGTIVALLVFGVAALALSGGSDNGPPDVAAGFELDTASGGTASLSDYRGQPVAVTFMHTY